jgi:UDP-GlcNAc3NAcA epimerase
MKVLLVFGIRPQIIKMSLLQRALLEAGHKPLIVYTGQHYDSALSWRLFDELRLPFPDRDLRITSGSGTDLYTDKYQLEEGNERLSEVIDEIDPACVIVVGDGNPAAIGAWGAISRKVPLVHAEAGLRNHNTKEVEERNRLFIDSVSDLLCCPTRECEDNVTAEGLSGQVHFTGDLLFDAWKLYAPRVGESRPISLNRDVASGDFCLFTLHKRTTAYDAASLESVVDVLMHGWPLPIVWPIHPGVQHVLEITGLLGTLKAAKHIYLLPPVPYLQMRWLEENCAIVVTDSVGVQVEAYLARRQSVVLREEVEHHSIGALGWSVNIKPVASELRDITYVVRDRLSCRPSTYDERLFGDGHAAMRITSLVSENIREPDRPRHRSPNLHRVDSRPSRSSEIADLPRPYWDPV